MALVTSSKQTAPPALSLASSSPAPPTILSLSQTSVRRSGIKAPTLLLTGHEGDVLTGAFSNDGKYIATGSFDKTVLIYNVFGECENWGVLRGHTRPILQLRWSPDSEMLFTCSADTTAAIWDVEAQTRIKKLSGHTAIINSIDVNRRGTMFLCTGSDDGTVKLWDLRIRRCVRTMEHNYQIFSVCFSDTADRIFAASLDHTIRILDLRRTGDSSSTETKTTPSGTPPAAAEKKPELMEVLRGHMDSVTGISLSHDGSKLASIAMDNSVKLWDAAPFCTGVTRQLATLTGATSNFEKSLIRINWSKNDELIASGSADRRVCIWSSMTKKLRYRLPGHTGCVNDAFFHPNEPIVASVSADKTCYMGELS